MYVCELPSLYPSNVRPDLHVFALEKDGSVFFCFVDFPSYVYLYARRIPPLILPVIHDAPCSLPLCTAQS